MTRARILAGGALVALLTFLVTPGLMSQDRKDSKMKGQLPQGWTKLDLTATQKEEIYKLNADYRAKKAKLQEEMNRLDQELARKRVAVLTDEQKKKLVELVGAGDSSGDRVKDKTTEKSKGAAKQ